MARRLPVRTWACGLAACLVAGCLFRPPDPDRALPTSPAERPAKPAPPPEPSGPAPGVLSDYRVRPPPPPPPAPPPPPHEHPARQAPPPASAPPPPPPPVPR